MPDLTNLLTGAVFIVLAYLCYNPAREYLASRKNKGASSTALAKGRSVEGRVVAAQIANLGSMFTPREHLLYVNYNVGGEALQSTVNVNQRVFGNYRATLKKLRKQMDKTGEQPPIEQMPPITVYYKNKDPQNIWCDESVRNKEDQGRTFLVLGFVCLAVAAAFIAGSFVA